MLPAHRKRKAVFAVLKEGRSVTSVARELGVARKTIYFWIKRYKKTPARIKKEAFVPKYIEGTNHPKFYRQQLKDRLLKKVVLGPSLSITGLAEELKAGRHAIYNLLKELDLTTPSSRVAFKNLYSAPGKLMPDIKVSIVRAVADGQSVSRLASQYNISRKAIYKWIRMYKKEGRVDEKYLSGYEHPKAFSKAQVESILQRVIAAPEPSIHNLAKAIGVSSHGAYNVLKRYGLTYKEARLAYAAAQREKEVQPVSLGFWDRVKLVWEEFIPSLAPAPPPKFRQLLKPFLASLFFAFLISFATLSWIRLLGSAGVGGAIGLTFASIALLMGSFFFLYSLKYYLTLAIVLSFSQTGQGERQEVKGKRGFLSWILGLANGNGPEQSRRASRGAIGLEPDLAHVSLKKHPFVSIHIPLYNEKNVVERVIAASTNFDYQGDYEVVLADDSTDETSQIIQDYLRKSKAQISKSKGDGWTLTRVEVRPGVVLKHLHRTSRSGFKGGALRLALKCCDPRAEFVSVFDADFVPYPDTLDLFLKYFKVQNNMSEDYSKSNVAAVQGYQWHVLNKSENWVTRGVRSEYAGSYVIERSGGEIYGGLKQISGAVYMIRRDVLEEVGWETSITEDFQLTLKLYEKGYKVVYTPYIQAPAECVSTLKRLIRQRMRWAEGHSNNVKRMFKKLLLSPNLERAEKLEFMYLSPYYLQAFFFLIGTISWLISETVFPSRLPFWTSLWGWSLVLTNMLALPLMNAVGLFLEESEERDYQGIASFVALSYILVPFQAYAAVKGFLEKEEGPWFRTPKTGRITDIITRGRFFRFIYGILPGRAQPAVAHSKGTRQWAGFRGLMPKSYREATSSAYTLNPYLSLATANNRFNSYTIRPRKMRWVGKALLIILLIISITLMSFTPSVPYFSWPKEARAEGFKMIAGPEARVALEILNPHSHPKTGEDWVVNFKTAGKADLSITPLDQATIEDLEFISLQCGDEGRQPKIFAGPLPDDKDIIFYPQWECLTTSVLTHRVNRSGKHTLKFQFDGQKAYAYNATQVDTSTSSSATGYSFQRKTWYDGTRLWSVFDSGAGIEFWYSTNWGAGWTQDTSASLSTSTNDFSVEADSSNAFVTYTEGGDIKTRKADTVSWWNSSWTKRKQLTVSAASGNAVSSGYSVKYHPIGSDAADIYNDSLVSAGDLRIAYWNGSIWTELDRDLKKWSSSEIEIWFKLQAAISAGSVDRGYYVYYGNSTVFGLDKLPLLFLQRYASNPVFDLSGSSLSAKDPYVYKDGTTYHMFYSRITGAGVAGSGATAWSIGRATSTDLVNWTDQGVALSGVNATWEQSVGGPHILKEGTTYYLYYTGTPDNTFGGVWKTGVATSSSISGPWTRSGNNPILDVGTAGAWDDSRAADTTAIKVGSTFYLYYTGWEQTDGPTETKIGLATSSIPDGSFTKHASNPLITGTVEAPAVFVYNSKYYMLPQVIMTEGSQWEDRLVGLYESTDGISWTKKERNLLPIQKDTDSWEKQRLGSVGVIVEDNRLKVLYQGYPGGSSFWRLAYATDYLRITTGFSQVYDTYWSFDTDTTGQMPASWTDVDSSGEITVDETFAFEGTGPKSMKANIAAGTSAERRAVATGSLSDFELVVRGKIWRDSDASAEIGTIFRYTNTSSYYLVVFSSTGTLSKAYRQTAGGYVQIGSDFNVGLVQRAWHTVRIQAVGSSIKIFLDDVQFGGDITDTNYTSGQIGTRNFRQAASQTVSYDELSIRKLVATEPSVNSGSEQTSVYPGTGFGWSAATAPYDGAAWFNTSWSSRKKIPLTGAGSAGTNYQVKIVVGFSTGGDVTCNSNCQTDFDDIRFTGGDGATELDHWRESYTASSTATFFVEVKDNLSYGSNPDIYMYYGNVAAASGSNGTNTFVMFDDFNDGNSTGWTVAAGTWTVNAGALETSSTSHPIISYDSFSDKDFIVETSMRITSTISGDQQAWLLGRFSNSSNFYAYGYRGADANTRWEIWENVAGTYTELSQHNPQTMTQNTWFKQAILFKGTTIQVKSWQLGNADPGWQLGVIDESFNSSGKIGFKGTWVAATVQFDDVLVRKYTSPEPDIGTAGSEEGQYNDFSYSAVSKDSTNKIWVSSVHRSSTNYIFKASQSTNANDDSAWGAASSLDTSTNSNKFGVIVSIGSGNMYSVWIDATAIEGKKFTSGVGWDASPVSIATGTTGLSNNMSAVADSSGNVHLLYINSSDSAIYQEYTGSWQTAVTLDSNTGNDYLTISLNTANSDLYTIWIRANIIYYKKGVSPYASANWDSTATSWQSTGTNAWATSNYSGNGMVFAQWTQGTVSPFSIQWDFIIIPELVWLFLPMGPFLPLLLKRKKK